MNIINVKVEKVNGILVTTSNRVAEELGVEHKNLIRKIDDYISKFGSSSLSHEFYVKSTFGNRGKTYRNYLITKKGIAQLIGGYSSAVERAFELNVAYINKFDEMERMIYSGKQLPIEYPTKSNLQIRTFRGTPVMEIKLLSQITELFAYQITMRARIIGVPTLEREALKEYKVENREVENNIPRLIVLFKEHVINICKYYEIYEKVKDVIANYFKDNNKITYKKQVEVKINDKHTIEELELVLKASEFLTEKLQRHYIAEHIIEEIMGDKFFDTHYFTKMALMTKAEIQTLSPEKKKIIERKWKTSKIYNQLDSDAKEIVDYMLGKEI